MRWPDDCRATSLQRSPTVSASGWGSGSRLMQSAPMASAQCDCRGSGGLTSPRVAPGCAGQLWAGGRCGQAGVPMAPPMHRAQPTLCFQSHRHAR